MTLSRKCPLCGRPSHARYKPFCSKRCADLDLGRWLKGHYGIPAVESEDDRPSGEPNGGVED